MVHSSCQAQSQARYEVHWVFADGMAIGEITHDCKKPNGEVAEVHPFSHRSRFRVLALVFNGNLHSWKLQLFFPKS